MTDTQIRQIMQGMEEQNKVLAQLKKDGEDRADAHFKVWQSLREDAKNLRDDNRKLSEQIEELKTDTAPVVKLSKDVQGSGRILFAAFKFILGLGAIIGAGYTILHFVRKLILKE